MAVRLGSLFRMSIGQNLKFCPFLSLFVRKCPFCPMVWTMGQHPSYLCIVNQTNIVATY